MHAFPESDLPVEERTEEWATVTAIRASANAYLDTEPAAAGR